jgi:hypothetical protein
MTFALNRYANGDINYIAKMNVDNSGIELAINALQAAVSSSSVSVGPYLNALFGVQTAFIGSASYAQSTASTTMTLQGGYVWRPDLPAIANKVGTTALNFSGQTAGTYYIVVDATGSPSIQTASTFALYSVVWTGTAFGAITRLAPIVWSFQDWEDAQVSTALGVSYTSLDARLEAIEAASLLVGAGSLITYASAAGALNNVNPGGSFPTGISGLDVTLASGAANWTGLLAGSDGQRVSISNQDATNILTLNSQNAGSTAANRFSAAADMALVPGQTLGLVYRAGSINRWRIVG